MTDPLKQAENPAHPRDNHNKKSFRKGYNACPLCGKEKFRRSSVCQECFSARQKLEHPYPGYDACPQCGTIKAIRALICRNCFRDEKRSPVINGIHFVDGEPCRYLPLTRGLYAIVDADLYDWLMQRPWRAHKGKGSNTFYAMTFVDCNGISNGISYQLHREILHPPPDKQCDHRNGNGLDNRRSNLRECTNSQNQMNRPPRKANKSGHAGVWFDNQRRKWAAQISIKGKTIPLGRFAKKEDAIKIRQEKEQQCYGEFAFGARKHS